MSDDIDVFVSNLKHACATMPSVSHFCREHGFNRQQFNRYISGQSRPSAHNMLRIASAFGLSPSDFSRPAAVFERLVAGRNSVLQRHDTLQDAYPGDLAALRRYLGFYQTWHISLSWPGHIVCSCSHLREDNDQVHVTSIERIEMPENGIRQRSRYTGLAAYRRGRIFVTERTQGNDPTFGQTILLPFEMHQRLFLRGLTMGISWRRDNQPYAARMIWRFHGQDADRRALLRRCGVYSIGAAQIPEAVASYLLSETPALVTL